MLSEGIVYFFYEHFILANQLLRAKMELTQGYDSGACNDKSLTNSHNLANLKQSLECYFQHLD